MNSRGEVAQFLDVSQFIPGRSAYECVAYSCALLRYAGAPGTGPTGSGMQASNDAQYWYAKIEGSNLASNTNGMSLGAEYAVLKDMGMTDFHAVPITGDNAHDIAYLKAWLALGYPLAICGAETGFYDVGLGERIPYSWTPTGNHCIVVSGVDATGNLLVHDCASIGPQGVRSGPRVYDARKMHLVSATAVWKSWLPKYPQGVDPTKENEDEMAITIDSPRVKDFFTEVDGSHWHCKANGYTVHGGMLAHYKATNGLLDLGLPRSNEVPVEQVNPPTFVKHAGKGITIQYFERGDLVYDPHHEIDAPPGSSEVYRAHLYETGAVGLDPRLWQANLEKLVQSLVK